MTNGPARGGYSPEAGPGGARGDFAPRDGGTVVIGLGNSIRGDDAVGLLAVRRLSRRARPGVRYAESEESNINLLEVLAGADRLLLLDTISTAEGRPGTVHRLDVEDLRGPGEAYATHQLGVARVLDLGRSLGIPMPAAAAVLALEIAPSDDFGLGLTPAGREGLERLVAEAADALDRSVHPSATDPCADIVTP